MSAIAAVRGALPPYVYEQAELTAAFAQMISGARPNRQVLRRVHRAAQVERRHLALPLEHYAKIDNFGDANDAFIASALELGEEAIGGALADAGLAPSDVDLVMSTTVTGIAVPSIEARLVGRLGLRADVKRIPMMGLGCVAGASGVARLHDYLVGHPDDVAVLLSVELCSLTLQRDDASMPALVASALFGDGAAAVVAVGARRAERLGLDGPKVVASRSRLYPNSERAMGWDVGASGMRIVLGAEVPDLVLHHLGGDVAAFLAGHGLAVPDVARWICHPGGPKVLTAVQEALDLPYSALEVTWRSLAAVGNLSSASVLHVLRDTLAAEPPPAGAAGVLLAMGPGFCSELVLLRW
jgi:alkylresorcinol/alkylpyrone synthase